MKLSIIIPVYRTERTLQRCVESILSQDFADYELILVDDGSPDACPLICDDYARRDKRVKLVHKANGGLSDARNAGIRLASAPYITFVDSDDALAPNTLAELMDELEQYPEVDILEYPTLERCGNAQREHLLFFEPYTYNKVLDYWFHTRAWQHTYACNKVYKMQLFDKTEFPVGKIFEDVWTLPQLLGLTTAENISGSSGVGRLTVRTTNRGLYRYCWNEAGITARASYQDLRSLYNAHNATLAALMRQLTPEDYHNYGADLQDFMLRILNVLLDLYELSGRYEPNPSLLNHVKILGKAVNITSCKLKFLNILGYHALCRLNKLIHKIYRRH